MAKDKNIRLEYHLKLNKRNPRHVKAALALASVDKRYKSSFIALAIEHYMKTHPMGISMEQLLEMYRQSERAYLPKVPIAENLKKGGVRHLPGAPPIPKAAPVTGETREDAATGGAIDKAMDYYNIS